MTSLKWIKQITEIGLSLMSPDAQKEWMSRVIDGETINGPALAQLIDECKTAAGMFLEKGAISDEQKNMIAEILRKTDGKKIVANMAEETDIDWLLELKEQVFDHGLGVEDYEGTVLE